MDPVPVHRRLLDGWMAIVARFGFAQTLVLLSVFYATLIGPVAVVGRVIGKDLLDKRELRAPGSAWQEADTTAADLERAKQMT